MNVNMASTSLASSYGAQNMSASSSSTKTELTKEEQQYDADADGVLSATESAAMMAAQSKDNASKPDKPPARPPESEAASVEISQEAYQMYMQSAGNVA